MHEKSIIEKVTVIVSDFGFCFDAHTNYLIFGIDFSRKIGICVYTFLYVKKLKEYASKPIRDVRNIDGENLDVLRDGHRKTIYSLTSPPTAK